MAKSKKPKLTPSQKRYVKEVANLKKRIKRAEKSGFIFSEDIIPPLTNLPRRIGKAVIEAVKNIRAEKLYEKATGFISQEKKIPVSQGIELTKRKRAALWTANLPKKGKAISAQQYEDEKLADGILLLAEYNSLNEEQKMDFIRSLSNEDYDAFTLAKSKYGEVQNGRRETDSGRETGKNLLPDEGLESAEIPEAKEYYSEDIEPEGTETTETEDVERKAYDEEKDEKLKEWKEHYKQEKKKRKKDREFIYDGDSIYTGILARLEQFEADYASDPEKFNRANNKKYEVSFKSMLENEIRTEGFSTVMRRLDKKGPEIDTALETLLYEPSDEEKVALALVQLSAIIKGRSLTMQESLEITEISEALSHDEEDDDLDDKPIDQLI